MLLITMCAGMFLVQLDVTVVNVALPTIEEDLHAGLPVLQWVVDGYAVVLAALLLCGGAVGDAVGHRRVVLGGFATFGLASAACALAWSAPALVAARAVQGLGAALLLPGTLAVITSAYRDSRERARALGVWAGVSALALSAGPLLGGLLVAGAGWRVLFWVNVPLAALAVFGCHRLVPGGGYASGRRVPVLAALAGAVALAALVFGVIDLGVPGPAVLPVLSFTVAAAAGAVLVLAERRAADPFLPRVLLRSRRFVSANLVAGTMNFVGLGTTFVATLYLQGVLGDRPLAAGIRLLPLSVLAPVSGRLTARYGPRPLMIIGLTLGAVSLLGLLRLGESSGYGTFALSLAGLGIGMGLLTAAVVAAAVGAAPPEHAGVASGVNNTARQTAGALGVAVFGAVAGEPADRTAFVGGLHVLGLAGAGLWLVAIAITVLAGLRPVRTAGSR